MRSRYVDAYKHSHTHTHIPLRVDKYLHQQGATMSRQLLHEVRDVLRAADAIASEREFCERWLGKSECYMRTLRFSQIEPSADALATVSNKLKYYAEQMHNKEAQHLKDLGVEFERLAEACWESIQTTARRKWAAVA
jgi:hypothetical protein